MYPYQAADDAFWDGYYSARYNESKENNPHPDTDELHQYWNKGYIFEKEENERYN